MAGGYLVPHALEWFRSDDLQPERGEPGGVASGAGANRFHDPCPRSRRPLAALRIGSGRLVE
jgi:hypothetical protein